MMDSRNTDGVLLWKITDTRRRRRDAVSGKTQSIYSQPFYTSPNGYKMCARLYLNGDEMGRGTHLSLFFVIMRGEHDSLLQWPFTQKVTYFVFDQEGQRQISGTFLPDPKSSSFERPTCKMNIDSNILPFMPLETLDRGMHGSGCYVEDGCLYILLVVDNRSFCILE
ncbi:TNF receptor-associated factor 3-like [Corticium candelabrum]|uniref:TNF receptor-associated factor 3-like n=1 Tax=Corticium candelabrum TaxID=121492 RepID=UPI002E26CAD6|nr:TNF receptor-associated factor 3-like [Corticium candelabrum]